MDKINENTWLPRSFNGVTKFQNFKIVMRSQGRIFCRSCGWGAGARAGGSLERRTTSSTRNQVSIATSGLCNPKKNNVYFRALPKLAPPPLPPNLGNLVLFFFEYQQWCFAPQTCKKRINWQQCAFWLKKFAEKLLKNNNIQISPFRV